MRIYPFGNNLVKLGLTYRYNYRKSTWFCTRCSFGGFYAKTLNKESNGIRRFIAAYGVYEYCEYHTNKVYPYNYYSV